MKIVIADDELRLRKIVSLHLKKNGFDVYEASNGKEAVELALSLNPDLIVLDINMPVMDGFEAARELKSSEKLKDIPIIFLTAKADMESIEKGKDLKAAYYLTKPFSPKDLINKIRGIK
ncbi:two-component response regulator [Deferribacter desulfuricans SSM1]|uniref:Two-component response regulator n=1 Tax=Deferribacter desulfuricans (strain DSM 14783 / JCM 11476 / NBRC 101012 / SSM1) TaxID=639282 RepID=D3P8R3_DEFDS|nr:response regulator [Deferribacter desulfuricans]BAI81103.1 two-component response regulator [Deferribacter desulfuricans SSM1]